MKNSLTSWNLFGIKHIIYASASLSGGTSQKERKFEVRMERVKNKKRSLKKQ
jgi:hypothetical protein